MDERENYASRLSTVLERMAEVVESIPASQADARVIESGSTPAMIVSHVLGSVRGSLLGIASGRDVYRNRDEEFEVAGVATAELAERLRRLSAEISEVFGAPDAPALEETVFPPQSLLGLQQQREMQRREPVLGAIAHAAEHLGELQLIRDLMARG